MNAGMKWLDCVRCAAKDILGETRGKGTIDRDTWCVVDRNTECVEGKKEKIQGMAECGRELS